MSDIHPPKKVEPTPLPVKENSKLIRHFITDLDGNEIEDYDTGGKIVLNIKTKNAEGKNISIDLNDTEHDFKYQGKVLENDTLKNFTVGSYLEKLELEVIEQKK